MLSREELETFKEEIKRKNLKSIKKELKSPFETSEGIYSTAYLNWRFNPWNLMDEINYPALAEGYIESGLFLLEECLVNNRTHKADIWVFPILFDIVQGIELKLKFFNSRMEMLKYYQENFSLKHFPVQGGHNIKSLCDQALSHLELFYIGEGEKFKDDAKELRALLNFVKSFTLHISNYTNDMAFMRYPESKLGQSHFYISKDNTTVGLKMLYSWALKTNQCLDGCLDFVCGYLDCIQEWRTESRGQY